VIKVHRVLMAGALLALASAPAQAASLTAGLSLAGFNVVQFGGSNLSTSTSVLADPTVASSQGTGALSGVTAGTSFGPSEITFILESTGFGFHLQDAAGDMFLGTSGQIVQRTADFVDLYILGTLTVNGVSGDASVRISLNQSGNALSEAITLNAPSVAVPEPASIAMAGIGLVAAGLVGLRRRSA
jgi:hypothetical protein